MSAGIVRPAVPPRPTVPTAPKPVGVAPDPVAAAPVAAAPVAAAPVAAAPVATTNTVATDMTAETPKKRGKQAGTLVPYFGCFGYDEAGTLQYDQVGNEQVPRRKKIDGVPALAADPAVEGDAGFNPATMVALKPADFLKRGDYWRFQSLLAIRRNDECLKNAAAADAGKTRGPAKKGNVAVLNSKIMDLLAILEKQMDPESFAIAKAKALEGMQTAANAAS